MTPEPLAQLRNRIDELDRRLIEVVAERLAVCHQVAEHKQDAGAEVIQPERVRTVLTTRRQWAIEAGVDPDFVEQLLRVLLTETHRIEVVRRRTDPAPSKVADVHGVRDRAPAGLDTVASRVDHLVLAVESAPDAAAMLASRFGFHRVAARDPADGGERSEHVLTVAAGGLSLVLVGRAASPAVARYLDRHGPGVQQVAVEVLDAAFTRACLDELGAHLVTPILVDRDGHEQFFAADEARIGVRFGFLARTGHRVGIGAGNVLAMFDALDEPG